MSEPLDASEESGSRIRAASEQWLGGEAFLGSGYREAPGPKLSRFWSQGEVLALCLGAMTLGAALGLMLGRPNR